MGDTVWKRKMGNVKQSTLKWLVLEYTFLLSYKFYIHKQLKNVNNMMYFLYSAVNITLVFCINRGREKKTVKGAK